MLHIAIIGAGPAGFYTAEALTKTLGEGNVAIDIIDRLPTPYGLIRAGVAPDHQSIKAVSKRYDATASSPNTRFTGHLDVGSDVSVAELQSLYHAVVLATGAPADRPLGIPGEDLSGVLGSGAFTGWYNGHPDHAALDVMFAAGVAVVGNGNVAIDVARVIAKTEAELLDSDVVAHAAAPLRAAVVRNIHIVGRRGPHQASFTPKEMGELGHLARAQPLVDPGDLPPVEADAALEPGLRKTVGHLRAFAAEPRSAKPIAIHFDFFSRPLRIEGDGRVAALVVERTRLDAGGGAVGTGEYRSIACGLVVSCIGYLTPSVPGVPHDDRAGRFASDKGRIAPGLYAVGWAEHGPRGTIGTNRPDAFAVAAQIAADAPTGDRAGRAGLDALIAARRLVTTSFEHWRAIDAAEIAAARPGSPREKLVRREAMLALGR